MADARENPGVTGALCPDGAGGYRAPGPQMMEAVLGHIPAYVYLLDTQSRYIHANLKYEELVGKRLDELLGRSIVNVFGEEIGRPMVVHNEQVLREKRTIEFEESAWFDGQRRFYTSIKAPLMGPDGVIGILGISTDITERKRVEEALRISDERYRLVSLATSDPIWDWDIADDTLVWNDAACEQFGWTPAEARSTINSWYDRIHPDDIERVAQAIHAAIDGAGDSWTDEYRFRLADGSYGTYLDRGHISRDPCGKPLRMLGSMMNTTELRRTEAALRHSEQRFRDLADNIAQLAWMADASGSIFWFNQRWFDYTGSTLERERGMGWQAHHHPDHVQRVVAGFTRHMQEGTLWEDTFPMRGKDGEYRWFLSRAVPIRDESGKVTRWFGTHTDVTEQRKVQEALQKANEAAETASRAKDHFLAVLSHELRTPLSPALIAATMIERDTQLPEHLREYISIVRRNVELEAKLIDDLLDLTRIARGKLLLDRQLLDCCEVLRHSAAICRNEANEKGVLLEESLPAEPLRVWGDSARLHQVFWNLLRNAIKFTPAGGSVTVRAERDEHGWAHIEVVDTGVGIGRELLPKIFDAFEQGGWRVTQRFGGLGLGLAISKGLVELHDGIIRAASEGVGKGATFTVDLPPAGELSVAKDEKKPLKQVAGNDRYRILLVEDHESTAKVTARLLRSAGHLVTVAEDMEHAVEAFARDEFDLLISDLGLPDGSGHDLLRYVLTKKPIKAIALSGYGMDNDLRASAAAGFNEHLTKPVNPAQLEESIRRVMSGS